MSFEVHIDWQGQTHLVGRLHAAERNASVSFEYALDWLQRADAFAIDPTALPLQRGPHHESTLFGAMQDCGPDRWGRVLIERAVRKKVLTQKPYRDIDWPSRSFPNLTTRGTLRRAKFWPSHLPVRRASKSRNTGSYQWENKASPSSRVLIVPDKTGFRLSPRRACWDCRSATWVRTPNSRTASANTATMSRVISANYGGAWSSRCWPATMTTTFAITDSSCGNPAAGHSRLHTISTLFQ